MPKLNQAGAAHILAILLLLLGLLATLYLVQNPTVLNPKAADYKSDPSSAVLINGKKCANNVCEVDSNEFELKIDVDGLNSQ